MKFQNGPSVRLYCIGCNYFNADYTCKKDSNLELYNSLRTPEKCPMIIKVIRKEKLNEINENIL